MGDAEVMTTGIITMLSFRGNFETARRFLHEQGYIPNALSKRRFNRRLHRISELFLTLFSILGEIWNSLNESTIYVIDSFPMLPVTTTASVVPNDTEEKYGEVVKPEKRRSFTA